MAHLPSLGQFGLMRSASLIFKYKIHLNSFMFIRFWNIKPYSAVFLTLRNLVFYNKKQREAGINSWQGLNIIFRDLVLWC